MPYNLFEWYAIIEFRPIFQGCKTIVVFCIGKKCEQIESELLRFGLEKAIKTPDRNQKIMKKIYLVIFGFQMHGFFLALR